MNKDDKPNSGMHSRYTSELTPRNERQFFAPENGDPLHAAFDKKTVVHPGGKVGPYPLREEARYGQSV
ncbi:hypothetical protein M1N77_03550 [Thermodesulfovibrionales bacterium]|nr:hypothetical protein [Thermodesulfovibrionales bacterium]